MWLISLDVLICFLYLSNSSCNDVYNNVGTQSLKIENILIHYLVQHGGLIR